MIPKPAVIITSLGRTGTKFFQNLFATIMPDSTSLHEPDVINIGKGEPLSEIWGQIREVGVRNLGLRKGLGKWSLIQLSDGRFLGKLNDAVAARRVLQQRKQFVQSRVSSVYVESNVGYYGLIDVLPHVYEHHRVIYLIRDGRDWVQSEMNWGEMYGKGWLRRQFAHNWPMASQIMTDAYQAKWESFSRFEKVCWAWSRLNTSALQQVKQNPYARLFYFEDIFQSEQRYEHLYDLVQFATTLPAMRPIPASALEGLLERQIHQSKQQFPKWEEWTDWQQQQFQAICGPLMAELGYTSSNNE